MDERTTAYLVRLWRTLDTLEENDDHREKLEALFSELCELNGLDVRTTQKLLIELDAYRWLRKELP